MQMDEINRKTSSQINHKRTPPQTASACATLSHVFPSVANEGKDVRSLGLDKLTAKALHHINAERVCRVPPWDTRGRLTLLVRSERVKSDIFDKGKPLSSLQEGDTHPGNNEGTLDSVLRSRGALTLGVTCSHTTSGVHSASRTKEMKGNKDNNNKNNKTVLHPHAFQHSNIVSGSVSLDPLWLSIAKILTFPLIQTLAKTTTIN